jgi:site-specific DNA-adenine methylase
MSEYGIPYMGSKSNIAASLAMNFPKAEHFYDLFGGGGAMAHYMALNKAKKYSHFHYNELKAHIAETLKRAIAGEFSYDVFKPPWVSREEFHAKKYTDGYVCSCWSFGNNGDDYLFSEEIEPCKRSMHMAVVFDEFDALASEVLRFSKWPAIAKTIKQRRYYVRQLIEHYRKTKLPKVLHQYLSDKQRQSLAAHRPFQELERLQQLQQLEQLERLQQLQRLQQLEQLQRLQQLQQLHITSGDYRDVIIEPNSVVYCDIPYKGTAEYGNSFSHKDFFDWASSREFPVFISEYDVADPRFKLVYTVDKRCLLTQSGESNKVKQEKLYWNGK